MKSGLSNINLLGKYVYFYILYHLDDEFEERLMQISINIKHVIHLPCLSKYGMRYDSVKMIELGDYTKGANHFYTVTNKELFMLAVMKFGFEYQVIQ